MTSILVIVGPSGYPCSMDHLHTSLKKARRAAGYTQRDLAVSAGISRQAYASIEKGQAIPATNVAMRLALELHTSVESLFQFAARPSSYSAEAELAHRVNDYDDPIRLSVAEVGNQLVAWPLKGSRTVQRSLIPTNGIGRQLADPERVSVELLQPLGSNRLVLIGCDPATSLLVEYVNQAGRYDLVWYEESSYSALNHLALGRAHIAGCHLLDKTTGTYNLSWVREILPFPAAVVHFALWEQGLIVAPGNPKRISGIDDMARRDVKIINRESGSGSRDLLDRSLFNQGIRPIEVQGYDREANGHLSVAEVIGMGFADVGIGVKSAAAATGLEFVPLATEQYDLVIPHHFLNLESVQSLLSTIRNPDFKKQVSMLGGYDLSNTGDFA